MGIPAGKSRLAHAGGPDDHHTGVSPYSTQRPTDDRELGVPPHQRITAGHAASITPANIAGLRNYAVFTSACAQPPRRRRSVPAQRLVEVGDQVVGALKPDRDADHRVAEADRGPARRPHRAAERGCRPSTGG
jgi:hypothetical protein